MKFSVDSSGDKPVIRAGNAVAFVCGESISTPTANLNTSIVTSQVVQNIYSSERTPTPTDVILVGNIVDFEVPSWAHKITITVSNMSSSGSADIIMQAAKTNHDFTGFTYGGSIVRIPSTSGSVWSTAVALTDVINPSQFELSGTIELIRMGSTSNNWVINSDLGGTASTVQLWSTGLITSSSALGYLRFTCSNGTDRLNQGTAYITFR